MTDNKHGNSTETWERLKSIFHEALTHPANERLAFASRASAGDAELEAQLHSLLRSHDDATEFLETPAVAFVDATASLRDYAPRERVGPYRLIREIGRGGMGTVYLAMRDDGQFTQRVAIKVIKRGMDSDAIVARFRQERQIVAGLEHPNIARLLDGGTTDDGVPYFVMEYVEGTSIREYCRVKALGVRQRLELFRAVCGAVQFAHQNLVVHRDIKSSNVIVSNDGVPKLLDFGIARLLQPQTLDVRTVTIETVSAMTPEYASPEQLRGEPVTTATDVYSLGVLLYELLTGVRPIDVTSLRGDALVRAVTDTAPKPPSSLVNAQLRDGATADDVESRLLREQQHELKDDLDTIVLMALRKEPSRRYSSVERLSDDIAKFLDNRPVTAQRDTFRYRVTKFAQRNRAAISVGALVAVTLVAGVATTLWQARIATIERARAERRFAEIRSLATHFIFDVHDSIVALPGATPVRAMLVKQGLASLDGLSREAAGDSLLERELSTAYQRMGLVQGNTYNSNLGDTKGALASYRTAAQLLDRSTDTTSKNAAALAALALARRGLADVLVITGQVPEAVQHLEYARTALNRALKLDSANFEYQRALADLLYALADSYGGLGFANLGDTKRAIETYRASIAMREQMLQRDPKDGEVRGGLANALQHYGSLAFENGDTLGSKYLARSVAILEALVSESPENTERKNSLLAGYLRQRRPLADAGLFDEAMIADRKVLGVLGEMVKADPTNTLLQRNLGVTYNTLGFDLIGAKRAREAVVEHRKALVIALRLMQNDAASMEMQQDAAYTLNALGDALREAGQHAEAVAEYDRSVALKLSLLKTEPENSRHVADLAWTYGGRGASFTELANFVSASRDLTASVKIADSLVVQADATNRTRNNTAIAYERLGHLYVTQAQASPSTRATHCAEATRWLQKSLDLWTTMIAKKEISGANRERPATVKAEIARCQR